VKVLRRLTLIAAANALTLTNVSHVTAAEVTVQILAIGNNRPLPDGKRSTTSTATPLRFADDDAASVYELLAPIAHGAHLLTVMDPETQAAFPDLTAIARPPSVDALQAAVSQMADRIKETRARGDVSVVFVFYSGHGSTLDDAGEQSLVLQDGGINRLFLYHEILDKLPANYVHLIVDACHAEDVVRARDTEATVVDVPNGEAERLAGRPMLARYPHVGTIVAATSSAQTHEWDLIGHGIFTYELLSALRGAADVNHDQLVEYSEAAAFLSAANRSIPDPRVRLDVIASPPALNRRVALVDLAQLSRADNARLSEIPAAAGLVEVIDHHGSHLAGTRGEPGFSSELVVPADSKIYVRAAGREARISPGRGQTISFAELTFDDPANRQRGALADAIQEGLFVTRFGPGYYAGFIDHAPDFIPVVFEPAPVTPLPVSGPRDALDRSDATQVRSGGQAMPLVAAGISTPVARNFITSQGVRLGLRPNRDRGTTVSLDYFRASGPGYSEWTTTASAGWLWGSNRGPLPAWVGGVASAGAIFQVVDGYATRWSGVVGGGPVVAARQDLPYHLGLWVEAQFCARVYRRDHATDVSFAPSAWLGVALGL
jgi:hypothetical protein